MLNFSVLVPSAKLVTESLQLLGKIPPVIYPVSQRIAFDFIHELYIDASDFVIVAHDCLDTVSRILTPYSHTHVLVLPVLKDLGFSIYFGLQNQTQPVIIHFADTITSDNISLIDGDCFLFSHDYLSDNWTFFETDDNGSFSKIIDKQFSPDSSLKGDLFIGVFKILHPQFLRSCFEHAFNNPVQGLNSFYQALMEYSAIYPMKPVKVNDWADIGHADNYSNSRLAVSAREFNHISIDKVRGILSKSSDNKSKLLHEIKWFLKLPADLEYSHPRIFSYSLHYANPYIAMEYYSYLTLHELFLYGQLNFQQWLNIFLRIKAVCLDFSRYSVADENIIASLEDMYLNKTLQRIYSLRDDDKFSSFFTNNFSVNGITFLPLDDICSLLKVYVPQLLYNINSFSIIHGDLCFANIMIDNSFSFVKLIDPRGSFGHFDIFGDYRYDLAKLLHSIEGKYDFIIKDLFTVSYNPHTLDISFSINDQHSDLLDLFIQVFQPDLLTVRFIEALLFLSMIPLHNENFNHQLVMLGTGVNLLRNIIPIAKE